MRAGLLSQPQVIQTINERFVSTTITCLDAVELAKTGDVLAGKVVDHWSYPVTLIFLTSEGRFVTKLDVVKDLNSIHPDTSIRAGQRKHEASLEHNMQVFLKHVNDYFP